MILQWHESFIVMATITTGIILRVSGKDSVTLDGTDHNLSILSIIRDNSFENTLQTFSQNGRRFNRAVPDPRKNCDSWAPLVNDHHPSSLDKADRETVSSQTQQDFCPSGIISKFECKDQNGEGFAGNITAPDGAFTKSCNEINFSVICTVLDPSAVTICPDLSVRYYCSCPDPSIAIAVTGSTSISTLAGTASTKVSTYSKSSTDALPPTLSGTVTSQYNTALTTDGGEITDKEKGDAEVDATFKIGGISIPWWAFVVLITGVLFIANTCISVCLYRKATNRLQKRYKGKIHPLQSV